MALYEHIFLARQDVSPTQVEEMTAAFTDLITQGGGKVTKNEYWGLKSLSYRIKKNRKAHYTLLNIEAPSAAVLAEALARKAPGTDAAAGTPATPTEQPAPQILAKLYELHATRPADRAAVPL